MCNGAGNYATWLHRFHPFQRYGTQLAPTSGSMGYGLPAAVGAKRIDPSKTVVCFAGDGCFMMHGQEFATAVQYDLRSEEHTSELQSLMRISYAVFCLKKKK